MNRARWNQLVADAPERDGHPCRVRYEGSSEIANTIVVMRRLDPPPREPLESDPAGPVRLEGIVSACPACVERRQATA